ncbi:hypothetical protein BDQ12DRAFT_672569 [Crucibulum laeve]|uniref:Uncharacterized protein n=1 Tax=Crucibulum laeve TaxID=68775 RepID=A0A5C3MJZ9_9AGAR|nr:hypothetical protein BDQ12DRAFT_672569 [Crucibulum laeve]
MSCWGDWQRKRAQEDLDPMMLRVFRRHTLSKGVDGFMSGMVRVLEQRSIGIQATTVDAEAPGLLVKLKRVAPLGGLWTFLIEVLDTLGCFMIYLNCTEVL